MHVLGQKDGPALGAEIVRAKRRMGIGRDLQAFGDEEDRIRERMMQSSRGGTMNARQMLQDIKGPFGEAHRPSFPAEVEEEAPTNINVYTDGGVHHPETRWAAIGGFGIFWPREAVQYDAGDGIERFMHQGIEAEGTSHWNSIPGQRCDSTRVEIAAHQ